MKYSLTRHYKYKLEETDMFRTSIKGFEFKNKYMYLKNNGWLYIYKSYCWDGSSVPLKKLWRVLSLWQYDADRYCKTASLFHDALCQAMREGNIPVTYKVDADLIYEQLCINGGMSKKQASKRYYALRKFGNSGIEPEENPRNKIYEV